MKHFGKFLLKGMALLVLLAFVLVTGFRVASLLRESHAAQDISPKTGHFVKASNLNIFVQEKGPADGPAVVFIGGTMAWSEVWRDTLDAVANAGFHAVAIDLPPFGFSERPDANGYGPVEQSNRPSIKSTRARRCSPVRRRPSSTAIRNATSRPTGREIGRAHV